MRKLTRVSDVTSYDNPKELALLEDIQKEILDSSDEVISKINQVVENHVQTDFPF